MPCSSADSFAPGRIVGVYRGHRQGMMQPKFDRPLAVMWYIPEERASDVFAISIIIVSCIRRLVVPWHLRRQRTLRHRRQAELVRSWILAKVLIHCNQIEGPRFLGRCRCSASTACPSSSPLLSAIYTVFGGTMIAEGKLLHRRRHATRSAVATQ